MAWGDPSSVWLVPANLALIATTGVCAYHVCRSVGDEVRQLWTKVAVPRESHAFDVAGLGVTMADGGEQLSKKD